MRSATGSWGRSESLETPTRPPSNPDCLPGDPRLARLPQLGAFSQSGTRVESGGLVGAKTGNGKWRGAGVAGMVNRPLSLANLGAVRAEGS